MADLICKNCVRFRQHYILSEQRCDVTNCGHCVYPRLKHRKPNDKACDNFQDRSNSHDLPDRQQVVRFLTKEILQYILNLKLPPEVEEEV